MDAAHTHTQTFPDRVHPVIPSLRQWSCFSITGLFAWHRGPNSSEILHGPGLLKLLLAWPIGAKQDLTVTLMTGWLRAARRGRWAAQTSDHHRPNSPSGFHTTNIHPPASTPHNSVSPMLHETNKTVALTHKATQTWRQIGKQVQGP